MLLSAAASFREYAWCRRRSYDSNEDGIYDEEEGSYDEEDEDSFYDALGHSA
jgi:hypothetical protein